MKRLKMNLVVIVSFALFLGGIVLLILRLPFWSLFLGLPSIQIGIVFIIFAFDKLSQDAIEEELSSIHQIPCSLCGKPTFVRGKETKGICTECDKKILKKINPS